MAAGLPMVSQGSQPPPCTLLLPAALQNVAAATGSSDKQSRRSERERWVLLKIPRGDIDGVGEVK